MSIDVTNCDLRQLVAAAYNLSSPQGLGFLHARFGGLSEAEIDSILAEDRPSCRLRMDYVNGRAVKLTVLRAGDKLTIHDRWYDHSDSQLAELCKAIGAEKSGNAEA